MRSIPGLLFFLVSLLRRFDQSQGRAGYMKKGLAHWALHTLDKTRDQQGRSEVGLPMLTRRIWPVLILLILYFIARAQCVNYDVTASLISR